ncbi:hypothetical protein EDD17DRAFT_1573190 [Pisolithus thermaeus]|nr:hypothetical protein EDD17DRAFT_1573190 [Pisolithus thermaeus]
MTSVPIRTMLGFWHASYACSGTIVSLSLWQGGPGFGGTACQQSNIGGNSCVLKARYLVRIKTFWTLLDNDSGEVSDLVYIPMRNSILRRNEFTRPPQHRTHFNCVIIIIRFTLYPHGN